MTFRQNCLDYLKKVNATKRLEFGTGGLSSIMYEYKGLVITIIGKDYAYIKVLGANIQEKLEDNIISNFRLFESKINLLLLYLEIKNNGKFNKLIHRNGIAIFTFGVVEISIIPNYDYINMICISCPKETYYITIDYDKVMEKVISINEKYDKKEGIVSRFFWKIL